MIRVHYESEGFPAGTVSNGPGELAVTWGDILWAAVTVGRPNRQYVFQHGASSLFEALFRWSLVRMAFEQSGPHGSRLRRTAAARTLDPTEKGAVNYFLGMTFCKLFADKLLNTPWLLHLDVFRPQLNPVLTGRSRPDMVGQEHGTARWHAFECKGRVSPPDLAAKTKAKAQAQRLVSVNGTACSLHVGAVTYLRSDTLQFYWRDPPAESGRAIDVRFEGEPWMHYYRPVLEFIEDRAPEAALEETLIEVEDADIKVGIHPSIAPLLANRDWTQAQHVANEARRHLKSAGYQGDGLKVVAGDSWLRPFAEPTGI